MTMMLDMEALQKAEVNLAPFPYLIVPHFLKSESRSDIQQDFPPIRDAGSFSIREFNLGPVFSHLIDELHSDALREIIAQKLELDLADKPIIITLRGMSSRHDGKIHTDSKTKIATLLLYMNEDWQAEEGRLRLLYDNKNLDNYAAEIPPEAGTLLVFKVTDNCWHGHKQIIGPRKILQMNYLHTESAFATHQRRHGFSAKMKKIGHFIGLGGSY